MDDSGEILRATFLEVVENQIRNDDPAATRQTFERLKREGHSSAEAKRLIAGVVAAETFEIAKHKQPSDETRFVERLSCPTCRGVRPASKRDMSPDVLTIPFHNGCRVSAGWNA
jgi:hypothetical protein